MLIPNRSITMLSLGTITMTRVPCKTPGCKGQILTSTAERTGGFCMPCVHAKARVEHTAFVERHRVDVDRFAGVTDPVEIIKLIHEDLPYDELKNYLPYHQSVSTVYRSLSEEDGKRLVGMALKDEKLLEEIAPRLALFTDINIRELLLQLLRTKNPYPAYIFKGADQQIVMRLLHMLKEDGPRGHTLTALAWTKHPIALEQFHRWRKSPPSWASDLYVPVYRYTEVAGYEIRNDGIRNLYYDKCFQLIPRIATTDMPSDAEILICHKPAEPHPCPKCGSNGTELLSLNMHHLTHTTESANNIVTFPTCLNCGNAFFAKNVQGKWEWIPPEPALSGQGQAGDEGWKLPVHVSNLYLPRQPWEAVDWCLADGISQLGGLPCPINDPVYPECPLCHELMRFVGQIAVEELITGEGIYYAFLCECCNITTTTYDQT